MAAAATEDGVMAHRIWRPLPRPARTREVVGIVRMFALMVAIGLAWWLR